MYVGCQAQSFQPLMLSTELYESQINLTLCPSLYDVQHIYLSKSVTLSSFNSNGYYIHSSNFKLRLMGLSQSLKQRLPPMEDDLQ